MGRLRQGEDAAVAARSLQAGDDLVASAGIGDQVEPDQGKVGRHAHQDVV